MANFFWILSIIYSLSSLPSNFSKVGLMSLYNNIFILSTVIFKIEDMHYSERENCTLNRIEDLPF